MMKKSLGLFLGFLFLTVLIQTGCQSTEPQKRISVVFRYDDYSEISNTQLEEQLFMIFHERGMSFTVGVIPFVFSGDQQDASSQSDSKAANLPLSPAKTAILKSAVDTGIVDIALHGYSHQTIPFEGGHTEFSRLEYDKQLSKITAGKRFLEQQLGLQIQTFIPPWNRYDLNSIKALEQLGFQTLSADQQEPANPDSTLKYLPAMVDLNQLPSAVVEARRSLDPHPVIIILFHQFEIKENQSGDGLLTLTEFKDQLNWLSSQNDIQVMSIEKIIRLRHDLDAKTYYYHQLLLQTKLIPPILNGLIHPLVYESPYPIILVITIFYLVVLLFSLAIAFFLGKLIFPHSRTILQISRFSVLVLLILVAAYSLRGTMVGYRGAIGTTIFCGIAIGVWWSSFWTDKSKKKLSVNKKASSI